MPTLDPAGVTDAALAGSCEVCVEAVEMFLEILGAEAGNLALKCLATGGVYVAGGEFLFFISVCVGNYADDCFVFQGFRRGS